MGERTVQVRHVSDLVTERELHEFFSFSGEIDYIDLFCQDKDGKTAFVIFKSPKALEIALLLSGATIVDHAVTITRAENYVPRSEMSEVRIVEPNPSIPSGETIPSNVELRASPPTGKIYVNKAQEVVTSMLAKGTSIGHDAMNKAKAFDDKHRLTAGASATMISLDHKVGLTEKLTMGISAVNEKMKSVDQKLHVSDKTMAAIFAAERKINSTGAAVISSRYMTAGTTWLNGAFSKMAKAGQVAGTKTREKINLAVSNMTAKDSPIVV